MADRGRPDREDYVVIGILVMIVSMILSAFYFQRCGIQPDYCRLGFDVTFSGLIYDLVIGSVLSVGFFLLLVWWPKHQQRKRLRNSLLLQYENFRRESIQVFVGISAGSFNTELINRLQNPSEFRKYFKSHGKRGDERWYDVANNFAPHNASDIAFHLDQLVQELRLAILILDNLSPENLKFVKGLTQTLSSLRNTTLEFDEYDRMNSLLCVFWEILAGWSFAEGYSDVDRVKKMLERI